jgi:acetylglutamate kinase
MAEKLSTGPDIGFVGEITQVNTDIIKDSIANGYIPVISTIAGGFDGEVYNINADLAAAQIAAHLNAKKLILMTDIRGLLRDVHDENSLISVVNVSEVLSLKKEGVISGGMIPKVNCCIEAIRRGVHKVFIIDGRIPHSILIETLTDEGVGTMFVSGKHI